MANPTVSEARIFELMGRLYVSLQVLTTERDAALKEAAGYLRDRDAHKQRCEELKQQLEKPAEAEATETMDAPG